MRALLLTCALALIGGGEFGCAPEQTPSEDIRQYVAARLPTLIPHRAPGWSIMEDDEARQIEYTVYKDAHTTYEEQLIGVILSDGPWKQSLYFAAVETGFALACLDGGGVTTSEKAPSKIRALRLIAEVGVEQQARVAAAASLVKVRPKIAKHVLSQEYANFSLVEYWSPVPGQITDPLAAGKHLRCLGVDVVSEVTSLEEFSDLVAEHAHASGLDAVRDDEVYLLAADRLNRKLRESFLAGRQQKLLRGRSDLAPLAFDCVVQERKTPTVIRPDEPGFMEGEPCER